MEINLSSYGFLFITMVILQLITRHYWNKRRHTTSCTIDASSPETRPGNFPCPSSPTHTVHVNVHPITVIIPALNEQAVLPTTISHLFSTSTIDQKTNCPEPTVIVVDAGSSNHNLTNASLSLLVELHPTLQLVRYRSPPSRGGQLNFGAQHASSLSSSSSGAHFLLFLHADTLLPPGWDAAIVSCLSSSRRPPALGTFSLSLPKPIPLSLRVMLYGAHIRAQYCGLPYGDQGYFLSRRTYDAVGGFPDTPIMEDVELLRRIRRGLPDGRVAVLREEVVTSPRRWIKKGFVINTILNQLLVLAWLCGVDSKTIYRWYYGRAPESPKYRRGAVPHSS